MKHARRSRPLEAATLACAALLAAASAPSALAASAVGHVSVTILPVGAGVEGGAMSFGAVGAPGRVVLSPAGTANGPAAGSVTLTGAPGTAVTVAFSTGDVARGPGAAMPFRVVPASRGITSLLDRTGMLRLTLDTTLSVGRQQAAGTYHGTYTVTVNY